MGRVTILPEELIADYPALSVAQATEWIDGAIQLASIEAPCLMSDNFRYDKAAKLIIMQAIRRWLDAGSGAFTNAGAGPFSIGVDTRSVQTAGFSDKEKTQLRKMCGSDTSQAFTIDTTPRRCTWR